MLLPGHLESTTLGDILGQLHRGRANGVLELYEEGRVHRLGLREGLVVAVQTPLLATRLGDLLRRHYQLSHETRRALERTAPRGRRIGQWLLEHAGLRPELLASALRHQQRERLEGVYRVARAKIRFRAVSLPEPSSTMLDVQEFLHGRPRHRDRDVAGRSSKPPTGSSERTTSGFGPGCPGPTPQSRSSCGSGRAGSSRLPHEDAWSQLELKRGASRDEVRAAFRRLARRLHPDACVAAPSAMRERAAQRFARLSSAYHELMRTAD